MKATIGFLGLGAMGGPMARNLLEAGYPLIGFDPDAERLSAVVAAGGSAGGDAADVVRRAEVVCTSLPDSAAFISVAEADLLPNARPGQVFIALGTVVPAETRRIARALADKAAVLLDVPVSGGPGGAESGTLRMFAAGDEATYRRCRDILEVLGDPRYIVYCGPGGCGQIVKGVNQLAMGLTNAALLESLAFGVLAGVDVDILRRAVGGDGSDWRGRLGRIADRIAEGAGDEVGVKFGQLEYFLDEAGRKGFEIPLTRALRDFCQPGERIVTEVNRLSPSFWHELKRHAAE